MVKKMPLIGYQSEDKIPHETKVLLSKVYAVGKDNGGYATLDTLMNSYQCSKKNKIKLRPSVEESLTKRVNEGYLIEEDGKYVLTPEGELYTTTEESYRNIPSKVTLEKRSRSDKLTRIANGTARKE